MLLRCNQSKLGPQFLPLHGLKHANIYLSMNWRLDSPGSIALTIHLQRRMVLVAPRSTNLRLPKFIFHATLLPTHSNGNELLLALIEIVATCPFNFFKSLLEPLQTMIKKNHTVERRTWLHMTTLPCSKSFMVL